MKSLKSIFTVASLLVCASIFGQISIMFVDDNAINPENTEVVLSALDDAGVVYEKFDAVGQMRSPNYNEMEPYDMVIWYTGTDGVGRYLWNGDDTDNIDLMLYLQEGGWLWLMGLDFLYDRYATPETFAEGDFLYDFLGLETYFGQSYADDGNQGLPQLDLAAGSPITSISPLLWIFATLWYADACVPRAEAQPVYQMGPESYPLSDYYTAIFYNAPTHKALSFYFDPSLMDTDQNRIQLFLDVMAFFDNLVGVDDQDADVLINQLKIYPNPVVAGSPVKIFHKPATLHSQKVSVFDAMGNEIVSTGVSQNGDKIIVQTKNLKPGIYIVKCGEVSGRFVIIDG
jgi:hypothetical protein